MVDMNSNRSQITVKVESLAVEMFNVFLKWTKRKNVSGCGWSISPNEKTSACYKEMNMPMIISVIIIMRLQLQKVVMM